MHGAVPGVKSHVAFVCTAEKGMMHVKVSAEASTGHSSAPQPTQAIPLLGKALARLVERPHRPHMAYGNMLLESLATRLPLPLRLIAA